jgi:hypothetical protein
MLGPNTDSPHGNISRVQLTAHWPTNPVRWYKSVSQTKLSGLNQTVGLWDALTPYRQSCSLICVTLRQKTISRGLRLSACMVFRSEQRVLFKAACSVQSNVFWWGQRVPIRATWSDQGSVFRSGQRVLFRATCSVQGNVFCSEQRVPFRAACSV